MRFISVLSLCVFYALPAAGDWQYTRWGMSPDQVMEASKGQLKRCDQTCEGQNTKADAARLFGNYRAGEFSFTTFAMFNKQTNKLSLIILELQQKEKGLSLIGSVRTKYGEPSTKNVTAMMSFYVWRDAKDQISIIAIGLNHSSFNDVSLRYQPRITESNKGL